MRLRGARLHFSWTGMQLSTTPDISSNRRLALTALAVSLAVCAVLAALNADISYLGDTDDAMRLVMVRDLLAGRGWYDQLIPRLQPPAGLYMHWSRLVDAGLAGMAWTLGRVLSPATAEWATRFFWPMLWVFPGVTAALAIARSIGGRSAVFVTAILLAIDNAIYTQFRPGRIDHHDIQIVMTMVALAAATVRRSKARGAAIAGAASALGLAVGLEALPYHAIIGASFAIALLRDRAAAVPARAYGLSLAISSAGLFLLQTPPWRWSLSYCDAIALNLIAGLCIAGFGLATVAQFTPRLSAGGRAVLTAAVAAAGAVVYLAMKPACIHGPFAEVDPQVRTLWLDHVAELQSWTWVARKAWPNAVHFMAMATMSLAAAIALVANEWRRPRPELLLVLACLTLAVATGLSLFRAESYAGWLGLPVFGAGLALASRRFARDLALPTTLAATFLSPAMVAAVVARTPAVASAQHALAKGEALKACSGGQAYRELTGLPPGVVLAHLDLGPFVLAYTKDSVIAAPYHRMSADILASFQALGAAPDRAEAKVRALKVAYVVDCPTMRNWFARGGLISSLRVARVPGWLQAVSPPGATLQVYRVR
jgi:hypothetical protein